MFSGSLELSFVNREVGEIFHCDVNTDYTSHVFIEVVKIFIF